MTHNQHILAEMKALASSIATTNGFASDMKVMDEDDLDNLCAWSISCRLAAVPPSYLERVPSGISLLIRQAQELHPVMALRAAEREASGEPSAIASIAV